MPKGYCNPNDLRACLVAEPGYEWLADTNCPMGVAYDESGGVVLYIARGSGDRQG